MEYRSLCNESELVQWAHLCQEAFSEKPRPPPASYFISHFKNDPSAQVQDVYVAIDRENGCFVSSVRVFNRKIYASSRACVVICTGRGIGEVCTLQSYRRRGISEALLRYVIGLVTSRNECSCLLLHAAAWVQPLYRKLGFRHVDIKWTTIDMANDNESTANSSASRTKCELLKVREHADMLCNLSNAFNSRFCGPLSRSPEYVREWIAAETAGNDGAVVALMIHDSDSSPTCVGYACLKELSVGRYQLRDFGALVASEREVENGTPTDDAITMTTQGVQQLLRAALMQVRGGDSIGSAGLCSISVPVLVAEYFQLRRSTAGATATTSTDIMDATSMTTTDSGWMWMGCPNDNSPTFSGNLQLFWPIDSF